MEAKNQVLQVYPESYICKTRGKVDVRRPRTVEDTPALVPYVLLSGYHLTDIMAWDEAAERIKETVPDDLKDKPWSWNMFFALKKKNDQKRHVYKSQK